MKRVVAGALFALGAGGLVACDGGDGRAAAGGTSELPFRIVGGCAVDGVLVRKVDGAEYCVLAGRAPSDCPGDMARLGTIDEAVVCGTPTELPLSERAALSVVIGGRIRFRSPVSAIAAGGAAGRWPGVRPGERIRLRLVLSFPPGAWEVAGRFVDGPLPAGCRYQVDEEHVVFAGDVVSVAVWRRLRCDDAESPGPVPAAEVHELAFEAPDPGRYLVQSGDARATLVVAMDTLCPRPASIRRCYRGLDFAECPGELEPARWCKGQPDVDCLVFTNGCPAAGYGSPSEETTPSRDEHVDVQVDPAAGHGPKGVHCPCDADEYDEFGYPSGDCEEFSYLCRQDWSGFRMERHPTPGDPDWGWPSRVALLFWPLADEEGSADALPHLALEIDLREDPPSATTCLMPPPPWREPDCWRGRLLLDRVVRRPIDVERLDGELTLESPWWDGLTIRF